MMSTHRIARLKLTIVDTFGLHLRPAARFAEVAHRHEAEVRVRCDGAEADGKSVLELLGLAAHAGLSLELEARGPDADRAVAALAELIAPGADRPDERRPDGASAATDRGRTATAT